MRSAIDLTLINGDVVLAGSMWTPRRFPKTAVVMHPGSGPSDRHNDAYFPPIRKMILDDGHAVASFDKRGVGGSTGAHVTSTIEEQAGELASVATVRGQLQRPVRVRASPRELGSRIGRASMRDSDDLGTKRLGAATPANHCH